MANNQNNNAGQIHALEIQLEQELENPHPDPDTSAINKQNIMNEIINLQDYLTNNQKASCRELFGILKDIEINRDGDMNREATDSMFAFLFHLENLLLIDDNSLRELMEAEQLFSPVVANGFILTDINAIVQENQATLSQAVLNETIRIEIGNNTYERNNLNNNNHPNNNHPNNNQPYNTNGGRRRKSRKTKKSRKTRKSRKTKKSRK